jgi:hypothetical protein
MGDTSLSLVDDDMVSIDEDPHLKTLEIYTACLARLSEFTDDYGRQRDLLVLVGGCDRKPLTDKPAVLANPRHHFQVGLRSAATSTTGKVLNNYEFGYGRKSFEVSCYRNYLDVGCRWVE